MSKVISIEQAMDKVQDSSVIMIGGFLAVGTPERLIDAVVSKGYKHLTVIANDTGFPDRGIGKLVVNRQVKKAIVSHVGTNPETGRQMNANELEVELSPQGTLIERIRSGGAGLGGVLTPTGVGTVVADGKPTITIDGRLFLLEKPLRADVALVKAHKADTDGNLVFRMSTRNFNPQIATAADVVIAEVEKIVPVGELAPDEVMVPGIFISSIVQA
ncbi:CoA transferase subunit A [Sporomusa malonica]|uniref:Acetate CoA/acetoacetate CoA-transferase alpha subunit n=1 Tax=Sporomusa malonica TaxID=112901 RepID=A0A1W1ZF19_9FIRM|nr:3-oxoacid CoA-transferase subunit A [Sporomusa malonica]SMC47075.1 acetate CoA/acetoacetate CoA-transferase alpha subunit [Sporomusa malonica]